MKINLLSFLIAYFRNKFTDKHINASTLKPIPGHPNAFYIPGLDKVIHIVDKSNPNKEVK